MEDWEIIFEPGAVTVVEISKTSGRPGADVRVERYVLHEGLLQDSCQSQSDVEELLRDLGVGPAKASDGARAIWIEIEKFLREDQ